MGGCYNYSCTAAKTHVDPILSFIQLLSCLACTNFSKNTAYGNFFPCIEYVSTISLYTIGQRWTEAEMKLFHWAFSTIQWKILNRSGDGSLFSLNIKLHGRHRTSQFSYMRRIYLYFNILQIPGFSFARLIMHWHRAHLLQHIFILNFGTCKIWCCELSLRNK